MAFAAAWSCGFLPATVLKLLGNQEGSASFHDHGNALVPCMGGQSDQCKGRVKDFSRTSAIRTTTSETRLGFHEEFETQDGFPLRTLITLLNKEQLACSVGNVLDGNLWKPSFGPFSGRRKFWIIRCFEQSPSPENGLG